MSDVVACVRKILEKLIKASSCPSPASEPPRKARGVVGTPPGKKKLSPRAKGIPKPTTKDIGKLELTRTRVFRIGSYPEVTTNHA